MAIFGACFVALGLFGFASLARGRVWVEGSTLYSRTLRDADGSSVSLDATNFRLVRLYAALAGFIRSGSPVANERLQYRMDKQRPGLPLGLG